VIDEFDARLRREAQAWLTVRTHDGQQSMSWQDLERKFLIATERTIDESTAEEILSAARAVRSGDFRPLAAILRQPLRQVSRRAEARAPAAIG